MKNKIVGFVVLKLALLGALTAEETGTTKGPAEKNDGIDYVNVAAVVVALAALGYSIYEGRLSRQHDRLSVKPLLDSEVLCGPVSKRFRLNLVNRGLGPAIINSWELLVDGQLYTKDGQQFIADLKLPPTVNFNYLTKGSILTTNAPIELMGYPITTWDKPGEQQFLATVKRLKFRIGYETLYGESGVFLMNGADCAGDP